MWGFRTKVGHWDNIDKDLVSPSGRKNDCRKKRALFIQFCSGESEKMPIGKEAKRGLSYITKGTCSLYNRENQATSIVFQKKWTFLKLVQWWNRLEKGDKNQATKKFKAIWVVSNVLNLVSFSAKLGHIETFGAAQLSDPQKTMENIASHAVEQLLE